MANDPLRRAVLGDLYWSQGPADRGWAIYNGPSKLLVAEGPAHSINFGCELWRELTGDYPKPPDDDPGYVSAAQAARWCNG